MPPNPAASHREVTVFVDEGHPAAPRETQRDGDGPRSLDNFRCAQNDPGPDDRYIGSPTSAIANIRRAAGRNR